MKKITLNIKERISLKNIMPDKGSYEKVIAIQSVSEKLDLSVSEIDDLEFREVGPASYAWSAEKEANAKPYEVEFGDVETLVIAGALKSASDREMLVSALVPLYEAFCLNKELTVQ